MAAHRSIWQWKRCGLVALVVLSPLLVRANPSDHDIRLRLDTQFNSAADALEPVQWVLAAGASGSPTVPAAPIPPNAGGSTVTERRPDETVVSRAIATQSVEHFSVWRNFRLVDWRLMPARWGGTLALEYLRNQGEIGGNRNRFVESTTLYASTYIWQPWFAQVRGNVSIFASQESGESGGLNGARSSAPQSGSVNASGTFNLFPASRFPFTAQFDSIDSRASGEYSFSDYRNNRVGLSQSWRSALGEESFNSTLDASRLSSGQFGRDTIVSISSSYLRQLPLGTIDAQGFASRGVRQLQNNDFYRGSVRYSYRPDPLFTAENLLSLNFSQQRRGATGTEIATRFGQIGSFVTWRPDEDSPLFVTGVARLTDFQTDLDGSGTGSSAFGGGGNASYRLNDYLSLNAGLFMNGSKSADKRTSLVSATTGLAASSPSLEVLGGQYSGTASANAGGESGGEQGRRLLAESSAGHQFLRRFDLGKFLRTSVNVMQNAGMRHDDAVGTSRTLTNTVGLFNEFQPQEGQQIVLGATLGDARTMGALPSRFQLANVQLSGQAQLSANALLTSSLTAQRSRQTDFSNTGRKETNQKSGSISFTKLRLFDVRGMRYLLTAQFNDILLESRLLGDAFAPRDDVNRLIEQRLEYQVGLLNLRIGSRHASTNGRADHQFYLRINRLFGEY